jgi:hypothetical protein
MTFLGSHSSSMGKFPSIISKERAKLLTSFVELHTLDKSWQWNKGRTQKAIPPQGCPSFELRYITNRILELASLLFSFTPLVRLFGLLKLPEALSNNTLSCCHLRNPRPAIGIQRSSPA